MPSLLAEGRMTGAKRRGNDGVQFLLFFSLAIFRIEIGRSPSYLVGVSAYPRPKNYGFLAPFNNNFP